MRNVTINLLWGRFSKLLHPLTSPHPSIQQPEHRRKAQLLATLTLSLIPISLLSVLLVTITFPAEVLVADQGFEVIVISVLLLSLIYILSRSRYYVIGATLAVAISSVGIFFTVFLTDVYDIHFLGYLIIPVLLSNIFLSVTFSIFLLTVFTTCSVVLSSFLPNIFIEQIISGPMLQVMVVSLILIMTNRYRNLLEKDRRGALEKSENRYRLVSELMSDYAYSLHILPDGHTQTEWITGAFTEITGYKTSEMMEDDNILLSHPDDAAITNDRLARLRNGEVTIQEVRILTKKGDVRWLLDYGRPLWNDDHTQVVSIYGAAKDITQQRYAEQQLHLLAKAINEAEEGIFITSTSHEGGDLSIVFASDGILRMTGYERDEIIGHTPAIWYGADTNMAIIKRMHERIHQGQPTMEELVSYRKDGTHYIMEWYCSPVADNDGVITNFIFIQRDITARKQAEAAEREQRILAEALRDSAAALTSTLNLDSVLDTILASVARVVPHNAGSIMLIEDDLSRVVRYHKFGNFDVSSSEGAFDFDISDTATLSYMYETGKPLLIPDVDAFPGWKRFDVGNWVHSYIGVPIMEGDKVIGFLNLDSTELNGFTNMHVENLKAFANQASSALRNARLFNEMEQRVIQRTAELDEERKQLQIILDSMGDGMYYTEDSVVRYVNQMMSNISGYTPEELIGLKVINFLSEQNEKSAPTIQEEIRTTITQSQIWRDEIKLVGKDNRVFDASLTVSLVSEPGQQPMRTVTLVRDVSQEKALENRKNYFISTASHELRTPITNIITRLYLIKHQPEKQEDHLRVINDVTQHMKDLAEDLLDLSRMEHGQVSFEFEPVILQELIMPVVYTQKAEADLKKIELTSELSQIPLRIMADRKRITQVITNLVTNAINYTPENGKVSVSLKTITDAQTNRQYAEISVRDTGVGIAHEHVAHIFDSFYRVDEKVKGTGLGLSISQEIIELHGGNISVESRLGHGSCFKVRFNLLA